jgi:hypothetical protein
MGIVKRILVPRSVRRAQSGVLNGLNPINLLMSPLRRMTRAARPFDMIESGFENAVVHSVRGVARGGRPRSRSAQPPGLIEMLVVAAVVIGLIGLAIDFALSLPGHLLGLTPSFPETLRGNDWLHAHYRHIGNGYVLTVGFLLALWLVPAIAVRLLRGRSREDKVAGAFTAFLILGIALSAAHSLPVGRRARPLTVAELHPLTTTVNAVLAPRADRAVAAVAGPVAHVAPGTRCGYAGSRSRGFDDLYDFGCTTTVAMPSGQSIRYTATITCTTRAPQRATCRSASRTRVHPLAS